MVTAQLGELLYALLIASGGITAVAATRFAGGGGFPAIYRVGLVVDNRGAHAAEDVLRAIDGWACLARGEAGFCSLGSAGSEESGLTLEVFVVRRLGRKPIVGDCVAVGASKPTVRTKSRGRIVQIGLKIRRTY